MKNVTKLASIAIISTTMISAPAMASTSPTPAQPQVEQSVQLDQFLVAQSTTDLDYAFADEANVQALALTNDEMVETEGAGIKLGKTAGSKVGKAYDRFKIICKKPLPRWSL